MKKFSTQVFAAAISLLACSTVTAQTAPLEVSRDAPDKYVVIKGDTLWDISGRFLQQPWRWPELWQMNRDQIRDPHLIYPGDIVYLDNSGGNPRLRLARAVGNGTNGSASANANGAAAGGAGYVSTVMLERAERTQPGVRSSPMPAAPIPTIDARLIEPFLNRPLIVDEAGLVSNPRIVATQDGRVYLGKGDLAYVRGVKDESVKEWHVYRSAKPLLDPDTRKPIAWEAVFVGSAQLERGGDPATFRMQNTTEEIGPGDRLMPAERTVMANYMPRSPETPVAGRIVSVYRGVAQAGRDSVVAVNVGASNGIAVGNVLAISERPRVVRDRETRDEIRLPGEPVGHLLIFRVFDKIAYGLIMRSSRDVAVGDGVANP